MTTMRLPRASARPTDSISLPPVDPIPDRPERRQRRPRGRFDLRDSLVHLLGWRATILHGDPTVVDRWRWLARHLRPGPLRTLDAGCGSGAFTMFAAMRGNDAVGVSDSPEELETGRRRAELLGLNGVEFARADLRRLERIGERLGSFDQILLLECIEHIRDDDALIDALSARLAPGGTLLLTVPSANHRPLWGEHVSAEEDGGHVRYGYTEGQLRALVERHGLHVEEVEGIAGVVAQKLASLQFALCRIHPLLAWAVTFPLRLLRPLEGIVTRLLRYPALSLAFVARKPG